MVVELRSVCPVRSDRGETTQEQSRVFIFFDLSPRMAATNTPGVADIARKFDRYQDPYLADPYSFFSEARAATAVFYHQETNYWVVTRYEDIRQVFQNTKQFSASNTLDVVPVVCP